MTERPQNKRGIQLPNGSTAEIISGPEVAQYLDAETKKRLLEIYRIEESRNVLGGVLKKPTVESVSEEDLDWDVEGMDRMIENGTLFLLKVDGKVAGMTGFTEIGKMPDDSRPVHMGTRLIVLPEFRGQKLYMQLLPFAFQNFRKAHPDSPILAVTRNNKMKELMGRGGWNEIGEAASMEISGQMEYYTAHKAEFDRRKDEEGWTAFLFDPKVVESKRK